MTETSEEIGPCLVRSVSNLVNRHSLCVQYFWIVVIRDIDRVHLVEIVKRRGSFCLVVKYFGQKFRLRMMGSKSTREKIKTLLVRTIAFDIVSYSFAKTKSQFRSSMDKRQRESERMSWKRRLRIRSSTCTTKRREREREKEKTGESQRVGTNWNEVWRFEFPLKVNEQKLNEILCLSVISCPNLKTKGSRNTRLDRHGHRPPT